MCVWPPLSRSRRRRRPKDMCQTMRSHNSDDRLQLNNSFLCCWVRSFFAAFGFLRVCGLTHTRVDKRRRWWWWWYFYDFGSLRRCDKVWRSNTTYAVTRRWCVDCAAYVGVPNNGMGMGSVCAVFMTLRPFCICAILCYTCARTLWRGG